MSGDIVHVNSSRDSWIATLRSSFQRVEVIRTRHISAPLTNNAATHLLYRRLFDMVIVTGGERTRQDLIQRDGLAPDRVCTSPTSGWMSSNFPRRLRYGTSAKSWGCHPTSDWSG
ncbi:MAG: hypothetical protein U0231_14470 [Nitrospiraceae bacterium]